MNASIWKYRFKVINIPITGNNTTQLGIHKRSYNMHSAYARFAMNGGKKTFRFRFNVRMYKYICAITMIIIYKLIWSVNEYGLLCYDLQSLQCVALKSKIQSRESQKESIWIFNESPPSNWWLYVNCLVMGDSIDGTPVLAYQINPPALRFPQTANYVFWIVNFIFGEIYQTNISVTMALYTIHWITIKMKLE